MATGSQDRRLAAVVVDDDAMLRLDVGEMLETVGFRMIEAEDGDAAIAVLERHHLDVTLLFSDVEMPGSLDGFGLARQVASRWPTISIVIASGRMHPQSGEIPEGARFIPKPFSAQTVHDHLREIMPDHLQPHELREPQ